MNPAVVLVEPVAFAVGLAVLRLPEAILRQRRRVLLIVLAAVSALAAVISGASPTGWLALDVLLVGGVGAGAVVAAAYARAGLILLAGVICTVAGMDSLAPALGLASIGLVLVSLLVEDELMVDATAGGLVVQAALRLSSPGGSGMTAVVAALALLPLLLSAVRTLERPHRRLLLRAAVGAGMFGVVGAVGAAAAAATAMDPLRRGLSIASTSLDTTSSIDLDASAAGLIAAGRDFQQARRSLEAWWAMPARAVPVVAQHWRVLHAAAVSGDELAETGRRALTAPALADVQVVDGRVPLDQLAVIEPSVAEAAAAATAARQRLDDSRSAFLLPPLAAELDARLERVHEVERTVQLAHRVLPLVPRLLGADGPRRYFLALQTPVEARAGGGFMGNYGEITADGGRLSLTQFGRQSDLTHAPGAAERRLMAPDDFVARYARFRPEQSWANVNVSPDVPTNAQVIAGLYPQSGGSPIDGVISVDPAGLAALLAVIGPVEVPSWPTPITAANALSVLLFEQYRLQPSGDERPRVDFLGEVAQVAWGRLTESALPPVPQVLAALGPAVRDKHLFFSSTRPDEQRLFDDMGASGRLAPVAGDFVGLVTQNAGGNKIDYFLRRELDYRVQLDPGSGRLRASVRVSLHNEAPPRGLSIGLIGNEASPPLPNGTNKLYLSFYTPWDLVGASIDGTPVALERASELGRRVYSTAVVIPAESTAIVELALSGRMPDADDDYRLDIYRQPVVAPDKVSTTLVVTSGWRTPTGGEHRAHMDLASDATVGVPLRRR